MKIASLTPKEWFSGQLVQIKPKLRGWLHLAAAPLSLAASIVLVCLAPTTPTKIGSAVYLACSLVLFGVSAAYHRFYWAPRWEIMWKRLDHSNIFLLIAGRLAYIQLVDSKYNELAKANVLRHVVQYPPRGEVFDRNGEYLVQSRECYDLMVIYSEIDKHGFDTLRMCDVLGLSRGKLEKELANARMRPRAPRVVTNYISKEDKLRFDECNFRGFYTVYVIRVKSAVTCWGM